MNSENTTIGIYGIQDRIDTPYPQMVHDHSLCEISQGEVLNYLNLERDTRIKRDNKMHLHLSRIIKSLKLVNGNIDVVFVDNMVGRAFISLDGQIRFEAPLATRLTKDWEKGKLWWFNHEIDGYILCHELAHIFSCLPFYGDFQENSLLVHFDGGASMSNFSAWIYRNGKIIPIEHHWELKYLSALFNANALTFGIIGASVHDQNSVPGKFMGYSALGNYNEEIEFWLRKNNWFSDIWGNRSIFFDQVKSDFGIELKSFDQHNSFLQDIAATIQEIFMRETLLKLDDLYTLCGCKTLYYTGGSALNIKTNSSIVESHIFNEVYIPPCADDSGLSLGAASFGEWKKGNSMKKHYPYLSNFCIDNGSFNYTNEDLQKTAQLLSEGKVIGVCNGYGESGPRALGNRSLLSIPTKAMAYKVSVAHKKREWYRPVAPVMLIKNARYFTGEEEIHPLSKYMLLDIPILPERQNEISGVVHANGTSRIQTLFERSDNPYLWDLLEILDSNYDVKALINTSFNSQGEPIVQTEADARKSAKDMDLDALVINGQVKVLKP